MEAAAVCDLFHCQDWPGGGTHALYRQPSVSLKGGRTSDGVVRTMGICDLIKGIFAC